MNKTYKLIFVTGFLVMSAGVIGRATAVSSYEKCSADCREGHGTLKCINKCIQEGIPEEKCRSLCNIGVAACIEKKCQ